MTEQIGGTSAAPAEPGAPAAPQQTMEEFVASRNSGAEPPGPAAPPESAPGTETTQQPEGESPQTPDDPGSAPEGEKPNKAVKELIDQRRKRQEAEKEAAYWKGRAEALAGGQQPGKPQQPATPNGPPAKPTIDQFETYEAFEAAREQWMDDMVDYRAGQIHQRVVQQTSAETVQKTFMDRIMEVEKTNPVIKEAFDVVGTAINDTMAEYIRRSPEGPKILLHLHENMDETTRIARLGPYEAIAALGRIEGRLSTPRAPAPPATTTKSSAPPPVKPVVNNGAPVSVDLEKAPIEDFMATRNKAQYGR